MNAKHDHDATAHDADGLWQSIQNSGRYGEWVKSAKAIAAAMRNQEKRIRELEAALKTAAQYLDHPDVKEIPFACPSATIAERIYELTGGAK